MKILDEVIDEISQLEITNVNDKTKIKNGDDIVSTASKFADKLGIPLKNLHLPGHNFTGRLA